jgi:hypothetical protein
VKYYFYAWRDDGLDEIIHDLLRAQLREKAGRTEDPSLVVQDTQSLHAANNVPAATTGKDANKKVPGRKRGLAVDVMGLVIAVVVSSAGLHDNVFGTRLLDKVAAKAPTVTTALVDQGFKSSVVEHAAGLGITVEIVRRNRSRPASYHSRSAGASSRPTARYCCSADSSASTTSARRPPSPACTGQ